MSMEWTAKSVAAHFAEAFRTLRALPPSERQRQDFNPAERLPGGCVPRHNDCETALATWADIINLERAIAWSAWIGADERSLVWARAARLPWKQICADLGCERTTAWRRWQLALTMIAGRLNAQ